MNKHLITNRKLALLLAAAVGTLAPAMTLVNAAETKPAAKPAAPAAKGAASATEQAAKPAAPAAKEAAPAAEPAVPAAPAIDPATVKEDSSYGFGFQTGRRFAGETMRYGIVADDIQREAFIKGLFEAIEGKDPSIAEAKIGASMQALGAVLQEREQKLAEANLAAGKAFLAENAKKEGVKTTASGLQYQVITPGGKEKYEEPKAGAPAAEKQFLVNYKGTLINGKQFDASPEGQPVPMPLQVIPGFQEALKMMPVGSKWRIWIPSDLAYGAERRSGDIGPNEVLSFEVELVGIQDAPPAQPSFPGMPGGGMPGGEPGQ
jgi:FKBP-type peptidyl-prolyl cis-trans isomerase